ncbi:MAG: WbuC family cupin fold metalloprotein [Deltaproteobacteria bacterium]|jgi:cupin fold WbuC family metalloprotein|nr:WbuC family cupin fold metalloprotein [Deltaproteobacteria bacterium]MBT4091948.1 WbuC family cupin fold metalloprotein [Deltaproteobacteria bacterium]MBT4262693.1 WbuC family cupin fold metalloprotein [Deltaproteobacteria bacterium]MBT4643238.1 WbuC family cupin fold metalloprotein [Deltaproteobacteria bacterium]MBT6503777.1 WbuC family cupin fold metalloprotein [Deltaproteobacteria bacterium]
MLNAIEPDSYICPHRHITPPKDEGFLVLQGKGVTIIFEDDGQIRDMFLLDPSQGKWGVDIPAGLYHTILAVVPQTVFYEVKPGPYDPQTDKSFTSWAPPEGHPNAAAYLHQLQRHVAEILK